MTSPLWYGGLHYRADPDRFDSPRRTFGNPEVMGDLSHSVTLAGASVGVMGSATITGGQAPHVLGARTRLCPHGLCAVIVNVTSLRVPPGTTACCHGARARGSGVTGAHILLLLC